MLRKGKPMADVSNVRGIPAHPEGPEKKTSPDTEKFKAEMRQKAKTVGKIDPEEQKKRKNQAEQSEGSKRSTTPTSDKRDLSLQKPFQSPPVRKKWAPEGQKPVTAGPPQSHQKSSGPAEESTPSDVKRKVLGSEPPLSPDHPTEVSDSEEKEAFSIPLEHVEKEEEKLVEEAAAEEEVAPPPPPPPPSSSAKGEEKKGEEKEKLPTIEELPTAMGQPTDLAPAPDVPSAIEPLPPYASLPSQVQELFDRMAGVMTVMQLSGMTETVITLNAPQFASSVFFGSQIIIQEFSTAPKAFNVQLNGQPQAVALFQEHTDDLMAAFQKGNYAFRINRLETGHQTDRPLFKRKESASGDKDQKGDSPP
jgi:hypothetical protein